MDGEGNGEYYFINNTEGTTQEQVDAQIEMLYIQLVNQLTLKKKNMWDIKPIIPDDSISKIKQNLVKLGYTNAETNFDGEVSNFLNEYYLGDYLLKDYYVEIEDNAKTVSLLDWTNRALLGLISKNKLNSISNYEKFQNFSLGILMALGNNGIDSLNVLTAALNSISGPEYASYNYRIIKEYKENGIKAIESNVTYPIAYNAGKVITDAVLVAVGITGAVGSVAIITAGLTGEVASVAAEIFSFGRATAAVACTVAVSTAGVEASLVLAVNAGKNGIGDAVDLINAIKSGNGAGSTISKFGDNDLVLGLEDYYWAVQKQFGGKLWSGFGNDTMGFEERVLEGMNDSSCIRFIIDDVRFTDVSSASNTIKGGFTNYELYNIKKYFSDKVVFINSNGVIQDATKILSQININ